MERCWQRWRSSLGDLVAGVGMGIGMVGFMGGRTDPERRTRWMCLERMQPDIFTTLFRNQVLTLMILMK